MPWVKFDDQFDDSEDIDSMCCEAIALHLCGITWSARNLTDGFIPDARVAKLPGGNSAIAKEQLCYGPKPWWVRSTGGYQIRSFLKFNPSGQEFRERREEVSRVRSEAGKKGMETRWGKHSDNKTHNKQDNKTLDLLITNDNKSITPNPESRIPNPRKPETRILREVAASGSALLESVLPDSFDDSEFKSALGRWEVYRKERKMQPWKQSTLQAKFKSWAKYPVSVVIAAIDQSIEQNWQGIFPEKQKQEPQRMQDRRDQILEALRQ
jgi:hypothetical protein